MTDKVTDEQHRKNMTATADNGVECKVDGVFVHRIDLYLARVFPEITVAEYQRTFPDAKLLSPAMEARKAAAPEKELIAAAATAAVVNFPAASKKPFAEVFELGNVPAAKNKRGDDIMIEVLGPPSAEFKQYLPDVDANYLFDIDLVKQVMMATTMNLPMLLWGMHGTGKTTVVQQYMARTNRPAIRVQHTATTEEAHILGQYTVRDGSTVFEPGPLAVAMRYGLAYIADEYDFSMPSVIAVYQPVLEGQPLIIKEAPPEWRFTRPHPNFRFYATGNTNGGGDETGLYQGTQMQNAAAYSRFGITVEVQYMNKAKETGVVASQGGIHGEDAARIVDFAKLVRESYQRNDIGVTVSPRELINAAKLGRALGGEWKQGLAMAYTNRLNKVDREAVLQIAQRIFSA